VIAGNTSTVHEKTEAVALFSPVAFIFTFAAAATYEWHSFWTAGRMDVLQGGFGSVGVPSSDLETKIETIFN
jgi:hypothetical protein